MEDLVIYTTTQTHSLGAKAGLILGIKVKPLEVRFEDQLSLRGATLRKALEEDIGSGIHPFIMSKSLCLSYSMDTFNEIDWCKSATSALMAVRSSVIHLLSLLIVRKTGTLNALFL